MFGIALAILVSYGLASALGQFYGPIHPILPFLLLGKSTSQLSALLLYLVIQYCLDVSEYSPFIAFFEKISAFTNIV